jgi:lichenan operon transcriptional antiterminator
MRYLQNRYRLLFKTLVESDVPLTRNLLASMLGVSQRTVQSDIKKLNSVLEDNGATVISKPGVGFYIEVDDNILFSRFKEDALDVSSENQVLSPVDPKGASITSSENYC